MVEQQVDARERGGLQLRLLWLCLRSEVFLRSTPVHQLSGSSRYHQCPCFELGRIHEGDTVKRIIFAITILTPAVARANYTCTGTVDHLAVAPSGTITVSVGSLQWVYLCRV